MCSLRTRRCRQTPGAAFRSLRQLDAQWRGERAVETNADPDVALQAFEAEVIPAGRDFAGVVEEHHVDARRLGIQRNSPDISRLWRSRNRQLDSPQRAAAAERRQQEIRHLVAVVERRLHQPVQRDDPVLAQNRNVLDDLAVDAIEAVGFVLVRVVVIRTS